MNTKTMFAAAMLALAMSVSGAWQETNEIVLMEESVQVKQDLNGTFLTVYALCLLEG